MSIFMASHLTNVVLESSAVFFDRYFVQKEVSEVLIFVFRIFLDW